VFVTASTQPHSATEHLELPFAKRTVAGVVGGYHPSAGNGRSLEHLERCERGRIERTRNASYCKVPWVQIPPSPPSNNENQKASPKQQCPEPNGRGIVYLIESTAVQERSETDLRKSRRETAKAAHRQRTTGGTWPPWCARRTKPVHSTRHDACQPTT
jgi:hypothetical protein